MGDEAVIGVDSQCLSYVIDAMQGVEKPEGPLADEKIALFRTYLYTQGTLWITPTVVDECSRIRDEDRRQLHDSYIGVLFGEWPVVPNDLLEARVTALGGFHPGEADCRILAESEAAGFSALLTYDEAFRGHLQCVESSTMLARPSEYWESLAIPQGSKPEKVPHTTNPLAGREWWLW